jgi:hypothetical protein
VIRAGGISLAMMAAIAMTAAAPSEGAQWRRPVTVSDDRAMDVLDDFSGFTSSPDGGRVDLVTMRYHTGIVVYPVHRAGGLGRGIFLPGSKDANYPWSGDRGQQEGYSQYPDAAVNEYGLLAVAWQTLTRGAELGNCDDCAIRLDVGPVGGHFGTINLTGTNETLLGVKVTPEGQVRVLSEAWEAGEDRLTLTRLDRPWRSATHQVIPFAATGGSFWDEAFLIEDAGHPEILSERPGTLELSQEPFVAAANLGVSWPVAERDEAWSLLSDGNGLAMAVVANARQNALEVATPSVGGSARGFHRVSSLVSGTTGPPADCLVAGDSNTRGEALVAWDCDAGDTLRAALLDPDGTVAAISPTRSDFFDGTSPVVAFDDAGRGVVAEQNEYGRFPAILLAGGRFSRWRAIPHGPDESQSTVAVGVLPDGVGLATWVEEPSASANVDWAGRIRLDRTRPTPSPAPASPPRASEPD